MSESDGRWAFCAGITTQGRRGPRASARKAVASTRCLRGVRRPAFRTHSDRQRSSMSTRRLAIEAPGRVRWQASAVAQSHDLRWNDGEESVDGGREVGSFEGPYQFRLQQPMMARIFMARKCAACQFRGATRRRRFRAMTCNESRDV